MGSIYRPLRPDTYKPPVKDSPEAVRVRRERRETMERIAQLEAMAVTRPVVADGWYDAETQTNWPCERASDELAAAWLAEAARLRNTLRGMP